MGISMAILPVYTARIHVYANHQLRQENRAAKTQSKRFINN